MDFLEERRELYEQHTRELMANWLTIKGGILGKDLTQEEMEAKTLNFLKQMAILDYKFIDVVRDDWGFDPNDESASFGEEMETRWESFVKNHVVKMENGEDSILYEDKEGNYRLIPNKYPTINNLEFIIKNYERIKFGEDNGEVEVLPSITVLGIEGISGDKYNEFNLSHTDSDFFVTQLMILTSDLLDVIGKHKEHLKESDNKLFKILENKYKEIF